MAKLPPPPNVIIIGSDRNAGRWLRFNLDRHPQFFMPPISTDYYADEARIEARGLRWYREQFRGWDGEPFLGEYAATYTTFLSNPREVARRLAKRLPDARYLAVVGNPVDRFVGEVRRRLRDGRLPRDLDVEAFCRFTAEQELGLQLVADGILSTGIQAFVDFFGDAVAPVLVDDIRRDPERAYRAALEHLGADPEQAPAGLGSVRYGDEHLVPFEISLGARQAVYAWFRHDVGLLSAALDLDLSAWDPGQGELGDDVLEAFIEAHARTRSTN